MNTSAGASIPTTPLRQDVSVIGLVGLGHMISHYSQLMLAPLFPWLKDEFNASYTELGILISLFFAVSCIMQAASGFLVDRFGARPILLAGLAVLGLAAFGFAVSPSYWVLAFFSVIAGVGNGVFHPVDFTLMNRKVSASRLGHAYSAHSISGSLGWALAPAMLVPLAILFSWRVALMCAGVLAFVVLAVLWAQRDRLSLPEPDRSAQMAVATQEHSMAFLRLPEVWMCFAFFFFYAVVLSVTQVYAPEAARQLHGVPVAMAAMCLTVFMVCSAGGMVLGGFLVANPRNCEKVVAVGLGVSVVLALVMALAPVPAMLVPVLFAVMGFSTGSSSPSRDLLVKRSTPEGSTGRVYGVVYSGLDIGQAVAPIAFGALMDRQQYQGIWLGMALAMCLLIASAFNVGRMRRPGLAGASA